MRESSLVFKVLEVDAHGPYQSIEHVHEVPGVEVVKLSTLLELNQLENIGKHHDHLQYYFDDIRFGSGSHEIDSAHMYMLDYPNDEPNEEEIVIQLTETVYYRDLEGISLIIK
jgi:hypothetical protein